MNSDQPARSRRFRSTISVMGAVAIFTFVGAACSAPAPNAPPTSEGNVESRSIPAQVAQAPLTDQAGHVVTLEQMRGKVVMLVPFLTLCQEVCPMTTGNLLQVQRALVKSRVQDRVQIVEMSVDPGRDTPARLAAYAQLTGASWELVTTTPEELAQFEQYFGWYVQVVPENNPPGIDWWTHQPLTYDVDHSDGYALISSSGTLRFETGASPRFQGSLEHFLGSMLDGQGQQNLADPPAQGWDPAQALDALGWLLKEPLAAPSS